jgi:uncharacterized membrane protein
VSEFRQIASLIIISLLVIAGVVVLTGALPGLIEGDLVVDQYTVVLHDNGTLTEHYDYLVKNTGQYRMLFRFWQDPLVTTPIQSPSIEFVSMNNPAGTTGYVKDYNGKVTIVGTGGNPSLGGQIQQLAERSEIGIFNPSYYTAGTYPLELTVALHPPVEYDASNAHLNLRLVDRHIPYRSIHLTIPAQYVKEVYPHPANLQVTRVGDQIVISGRASVDETVGIELLLSKDSPLLTDGYPAQVSDVAGKTRAANPWYNTIPQLFAQVLLIGGYIMVALTPLLFITMYYRYGREKEFTVPKYLSFIPDNTKKPWAVNLLFKGDAMDFDEDGYYATLLDLHRKGVIRIKEKEGGKGVIITNIQDISEDTYEKRVLAFLKDIEEDGIVDSDVLHGLAEKAGKDIKAQSRILQYQRELRDVTRRSDPLLISRYIVDGRDHIIPLALFNVAFLAVAIIGIIVFPPLLYLLLPAVFLWGAALFLSGIALVYPSTLFGHWKDDTYKEKLEWDAFAYFLSDLALIKQYSPSDISQWGEWLVYGTALGVGKKVEYAMKELNVRIPEAGAPSLGIMHSAFIPIVAFSPPSQGGGGGFGGGSFGGGGGFGGGGVGGR